MTTTEIRYAEEFQAPYEKRERNERQARRSGVKYASEPCFLCGKRLTEEAASNGFWIHLCTDGRLLTEDDTESDSQGCFPVGSDCARSIPRPFKFKSN